MDRFPEAFDRFESEVDVERLDSYMELLYSFQWWSGERWVGSPRQWKAFNIEARRLGFEVPRFVRTEMRESRGYGSHVPEVRPSARTWRHEVVKVRGTNQSRYRDLKTGRFVKKPKKD